MGLFLVSLPTSLSKRAQICFDWREMLSAVMFWNLLAWRKVESSRPEATIVTVHPRLRRPCLSLETQKIGPALTKALPCILTIPSALPISAPTSKRRNDHTVCDATSVTFTIGAVRPVKSIPKRWQSIMWLTVALVRPKRRLSVAPKWRIISTFSRTKKTPFPVTDVAFPRPFASVQ